MILQIINHKNQKMAVKITPVGKKVLIKPKKPENVFPGTNIIIPEASLQEVAQGYVVAVGTEVEEIKVGDLIKYADYITPTEMVHDGEKHLLINVGDIFAIIAEME